MRGMLGGLGLQIKDKAPLAGMRWFELASVGTLAIKVLALPFVSLFVIDGVLPEKNIPF